jgi:Protein of unknown function (DUF1320)
MPFLIPADYESLIRTEVLTTVSRGSTMVVAALEVTARSEMESYLRTRYDVGKIFPDVVPWSNVGQYPVGQLVYHGTPQIIYQALIEALPGVEPGAGGTETTWKVSDPRHGLIRTYMVDITLYHAHSAIPQKMIPELRVVRYEAAIAWLKAVAKGDISPDLPVVANDDGTSTDASFRLGSRTKLRHDW